MRRRSRAGPGELLAEFGQAGVFAVGDLHLDLAPSREHGRIAEGGGADVVVGQFEQRGAVGRNDPVPHAPGPEHRDLPQGLPGGDAAGQRIQLGGHVLAVGRQADLGAGLPGGNLQLPAGVGVPTAPAQRHSVA